MHKLSYTASLAVILALLTGCAFAKTTLPPTPTGSKLPATTTAPLGPTATATAIVIATATPLAGATVTVAPTATAVATATTAATATSQPTDTPIPNTATATTAANPTVPPQPDYLDDRSTPSGLILSLFNAINRHEYLRAYAYWEDPTNNPDTGSFDHFQQGYQDTASVQVTLGDTMTTGAAAGNRYYNVPVVLKAETTSGQLQTFAGCYTLHLADPQIQAAPPFQSMDIQSADVKAEANNADPATLLAAACPNTGEPTGPIPTTDPSTIAASNYLDDRSTAVNVLSSLFNAINRKEYARAYSYWQTDQAPPFNQFQQGYQDTASVQATFGDPTTDVGAGQIRYRLPVALTAQTTGGQMQYFVGCYQLHLGQPSFQAVLPFMPLAIERAQVETATSQAQALSQMSGACAQMP